MTAFDKLDTLYKQEIKELKTDYENLHKSFTDAMIEISEYQKLIRKLVEYIGFESVEEAKERFGYD